MGKEQNSQQQQLTHERKPGKFLKGSVKIVEYWVLHSRDPRIFPPQFGRKSVNDIAVLNKYDLGLRSLRPNFDPDL